MIARSLPSGAMTSEAPMEGDDSMDEEAEEDLASIKEAVKDVTELLGAHVGGPTTDEVLNVQADPLLRLVEGAKENPDHLAQYCWTFGKRLGRHPAVAEAVARDAQVTAAAPRAVAILMEALRRHDQHYDLQCYGQWALLRLAPLARAGLRCCS